MKIVYKNDCGINETLDERLKYIREIQLDVMPSNINDLKGLMKYLGSFYKIYQFNANDRIAYQLFSWSSEDKRTYTLTFNNSLLGVQNGLVLMSKLLDNIKFYDNENISVCVKYNDIERLIKKVKGNIEIEKTYKGYRKKKEIVNIIIDNALEIAYDNKSNLGDVYINEHLKEIINTVGFEDYTIANLISDINDDVRVTNVNVNTCDDVLDIMFTGKAIKERLIENEK